MIATPTFPRHVKLFPQEFAASMRRSACVSLSLVQMPAPGALLSVLANIGTEQLWAARLPRSREGTRAAPTGCSGGFLEPLPRGTAAGPGDARPRYNPRGRLPAWVFTEGFNQ